jgi:Tfp pilus assembly protein PilX
MLMRSSFKQRRGVVAVLAMLFLVLFASLALGLYTASATNAIVSTNEKNGTISLTAAESGMDFVRYQFSRIRIPPTIPPDQVFSYVADHLQDALEGTGNLGTNTVAVTSSTVFVPANPNAYIKVDNNGAEFRATLERMGQQIRVKTTGRYINASASNRAVQMDYLPTQVNTTVYNYAVAAQGGVIMQKGAVGATGGAANSIASVMSAKSSAPAIRISGGTIGGDLNVTSPGLAWVTGGSVGGTTIIPQIIMQHTHVVDTPDFPYVDTNYFKPYAVNTYSDGSTLKNIRIPANTNPKFTGGATIQGILYVESPNTVEFRGNVDLQGFIVVENKNSSTVNVIDMRGNFSQNPLPSDAEFDSLRTITGISVLAPTTRMVISGSVDSYLQGNVILGSFSNGGSADWTIDKGSLIAMDMSSDAAVFDGKTVKFTATGQYNMPSAGVRYSSYFRPQNSTYDEVKP